VFIKYPNTYFNVTSVKANNSLRYSLDNGANWFTIILDDATYEQSTIINAILAGLINNGHFYDGTGSGDPNLYTYPFKLDFNNATGRAFFIVADQALAVPPFDHTLTIIDLTNNDTSTLYEFLGWTYANAVLNSASTFYQSDSDPDFYGFSSEGFWTITGLPIIDNSDSPFQNTFFISSWGTPWSPEYVDPATLRGFEADILSRSCDFVEIRIVNSQGELLQFNGTSKESNILIRLLIIGRQKNSLL